MMKARNYVSLGEIISIVTFSIVYKPTCNFQALNIGIISDIWTILINGGFPAGKKKLFLL